jgi:hydrogenase/urease accessory protein HupE
MYLTVCQKTALKQGSPDLGNALVEMRSAVQYLYGFAVATASVSDQMIVSLL